MKKHSGGISILVLVLSVTFTIVLGGLTLVAITQYSSSRRMENFERALSIAQAGIQYYRWHLAHDPDDFTDGTGQPGPYVHEIADPYGDTTGVFSLEITPPDLGSTIVTISSKGWITSQPETKRTIVARYGIPSLAKQAFLHNANVWFGQKTTVHGKVFSNGGIRMDGTHDSLIQSAKETYTCGLETGCQPPEEKPGIWGMGGPQELWEYPVTPVDFNSLSADFAMYRTEAQNHGVYLEASSAYGYHIVFSSDGNFTIYEVTTAKSKRGWSVDEGCENIVQQIQSEQNIGTYSISDHPVIFAEDHLWVDGVVNGKVTVVAARFPIDVNSINILVNNNLTYVSKDDSSSLGLIAQQDIIYVLDIPTDFEINAAMLTQKGCILRHNYNYPGCGHYPEAIRQSLSIYGALISNQKSYWTFGSGDPTSGFISREITYDTGLYFYPPPYFPTTDDYEFISWEEH